MLDLYHGDCLKEMGKIDDGSVDLVLCDLPYGTTYAPWDTPLDIDTLWQQWNRVLKQNGLIILFGAEPFSSRVRVSNIKRYWYDLVYKKRNATGFLGAKFKPLNNFENIMLFLGKDAKAQSTTYNPQMTAGSPYNRKRKGELSELWRGGRRSETNNTGTRCPQRILEFGRDKERFHSAQKPVALLEYLIRTYSNPGETVLDCCMGSGSTGVACVNTGRSFIGIELDDNYYEIAKSRILDAANMSEKTLKHEASEKTLKHEEVTK